MSPSCKESEKVYFDLSLMYYSQVIILVFKDQFSDLCQFWPYGSNIKNCQICKIFLLKIEFTNLHLKYLQCGAFCSTMQANLHPDNNSYQS